MDYAFYDSDDRQMSGISYVRVLHAVPGAPAVDVYANDELIFQNVRYGQFTDYIPMRAGTYNIRLYQAGTTDTPLLHVNLPLEEKTVYTLAAMGTLPRIGILPIEDGYEELSPGRLNIRFINLSPDSPNLDLVSADGRTFFSNVGFTEVSDYSSIASGHYRFFVRPHGQATNLLYFPVNLLPARNLSFYVVGSFAARNLRVLIPMDGSTYLRSDLW